MAFLTLRGRASSSEYLSLGIFFGFSWLCACACLLSAGDRLGFWSVDVCFGKAWASVRSAEAAAVVYDGGSSDLPALLDPKVGKAFRTLSCIKTSSNKLSVQGCKGFWGGDLMWLRMWKKDGA